MLYDLPDQYYTCGMDNLFISTKFLRASYAETRSLKNDARSFPKKRLWTNQLYCTRILYKGRKKADDMRRDAKDAVLEGGAECPDLVAFNVYGTKPVNFLSMAAEKLVWNIKEKDIYDKETKEKAKL